MKRAIRGLVAGGWLSLLATGCNDGGSSTTPAEDDPPPATQLIDGIVVDLDLDMTAAIAQSIGPAGGEIVSPTPAGVTFTLSVPSGAIAIERTLLLTPVRGLRIPGDVGLPGGGTLVGGVHFGPEGLVLGSPGRLAIDLPPGFDSETTLALAYRQSGTGLRLQFVPFEDGVGELEIHHFSGIVLIDDPCGDLTLFETVGDRAKAVIACAMKEIETQVLLGQEPTTEQRARITGAFDDWLEAEVVPAMDEMLDAWVPPPPDSEDVDLVLPAAAMEVLMDWLYEWERAADLFTSPEERERLGARARRATANTFAVLLAKAGQVCRPTPLGTIAWELDNPGVRGLGMTPGDQSASVTFTSDGWTLRDSPLLSAQLHAAARGPARLAHVAMVAEILDWMRKLGFPETDIIANRIADYCDAVDVRPRTTTFESDTTVEFTAMLGDADAVATPDALFGTAELLVESPPDTTAPIVQSFVVTSPSSGFVDFSSGGGTVSGTFSLYDILTSFDSGIAKVELYSVAFDIDGFGLWTNFRLGAPIATVLSIEDGGICPDHVLGCLVTGEWSTTIDGTGVTCPEPRFFTVVTVDASGNVSDFDAGSPYSGVTVSNSALCP